MKGHLRTALLRCRDRISVPEREARSRLIAELLRRSAWYDGAEHILTYIAFRSEVDTRPVAEMVWRDGKRLWAPKVNRAEKAMDFYEIRQWGDVVPGAWGIGEPRDAAFSFFAVPPDEPAMLLVPGVAFDKRGYRIGYGGGYYDRFFARWKRRCLSIGLAYDVQMLPWIPAQPHDWPVDGVLTERGWRKVPASLV